MSTPTPLSASDIPIPARSLWRILLRLVADRNPFYLISAACMLWGCLAMTNSHSWNSVPLPRLILLIATINVYEAMLIGLAVLLLRRGLGRDGHILLILQAFFLVDVTFLSAEIATANFAIGIAINAAVLLLAIVKMRLISLALPRSMPAGKRAYLFIQLAVLLAIPSVLRHIDHGSVPVVDFYGMWWLVGLMPVVGEAIRRLGERTGIAAPPRYSVGLYTLLPWLSLIAHVGILHYVYDIPFFGAMAAPVLLGFTFVLHSAMPESTRQLPFRMLPENFRQLRILRAIAPWAAVLVSLNNPHELAVALHPLSAATLTTTMLAVAAGYLTYIYCLFPAKAPAMLSAGAAAALVAIYGPSAQQMQQTSDQLWTWCKTTIANAIPTTLVGWGAISVIASFGFLAIGAAVSLAGGRLPVPAAGLPANGIPSESE